MKPIIFLAFANDKVDNARYLRNLPLELDGIRKALQPAVKEGLCEVIERANVSIEQIFDVFQTYQDRVAIFHYGGHADGYQLLLETTLAVAENPVSGSVSSLEANKVAHGEGLVSFFARQRGLQLVFFNGCSTQQQSLELVKAGISAVIGTSNAINDDIATTLSIRFYTGLAKGASIDKAWLEATDEVKMKEGTANLRGLYRKAQSEVAADRFPWEIYYREGAEKVKEWNLPEEVDNPLFGLPDIPPTFALPESPFLFLKRYERPHAELFFGRSFYVRELYNKITDTQSPPVILLYGQSGTGKSSLFDAGLNPRLENSHHVIYLRRNQAVGLVGTLKEGLMLSEGTLTTAGNTTTLSVLSPPSEGAQGEVIVSMNKRLQLLQSFKNQLLTFAESEKIDLSATLKALEKELSVGTQTTATELSVRTQTTARGLDFQQSNLSFTKFDEQKFLTQVGQTPFLELLKTWHTLENQFQKPVVVILDQAEELFTRHNKLIASELEDLAQCLKIIFNNPTFVPKGKLILGYRKEYQAEFEERFKECAIPRTKVFLEPLSRKDILDIFRGITDTPTLKKRYNLHIDKNLPVVIADDLIEDKDSPVAPVLQILLTKMWDKVKNEQNPTFTVANYQNLKKEGFLLDDFFKQQTKKLAEWNPELERSGLHLDILNYHTTNLGTAGSKTLEEIRAHYKHVPEKAELLLYKLKELYLLVESGQDRTNLTHDTLAPLVKNEFRKSERAGQRASRILDNQLNDFILNEKQVLDELEVEIVEKGKEGMRIWEEDEVRFVQASQANRDEKEKARKRRRRYAIAALSTILITALFSLYQWNKSVKNADEAKMKELMLLAGQKVKSDSSQEQNVALRLAEQAVIFAEHELPKEKSDVFENFRKISESYRERNKDGNSWLPPHQEIMYKTIPYTSEISQTKTNDEAFMEFRGRSAEFADLIDNDVIFDESLKNNTDVLTQNTLNNENLVIWIKKHSFRIFPYKRSGKTQIVKADSTIKEFLAVDSTTWFLFDKNNNLTQWNPRNNTSKAILTLTKDTTLQDLPQSQFIAYRKDGLYVWIGNSFLRIRPEKSTISDATTWKKTNIDTLFISKEKQDTSASDLSAANGFYWTEAQKTRIIPSTDLKKIIVYGIGKKAALLLKGVQDTVYRILPVEGLDPAIQGINFSPSLDNAAVINRADNFGLYQLVISSEKVVLKEVFNKTITTFTKDISISKIQVANDDSKHILVRLADQVRVYDFERNLDDVYHFENTNSVLDIKFSDDGTYLIEQQAEKIVLRLPIYKMQDWLNRTFAPTLDITQKESYGIASLRERWQEYPLRLQILAQLLSFLTILLLLIRYIPILIQLYKEKRFYKIVMYGLATLIFTFAAIYKELFTEIDENFIKQAADMFIVLSFFYLLVLLFEQRQELAEFIKAKNWTSLVLFSAPEMIVIGISIYAMYGSLQSQPENDRDSAVITVLVAYLYNAFVLWTIHRSEIAFQEGKYIKTFGLLYFGFAYLVLFSSLYAVNDLSWGLGKVLLIYPLLWFGLWVAKGIYHWLKKRF